jgi:hypothetical protein
MKHLSLIFIAIMVGFTAMAQDVTLIVNGQGRTKDEAINSALRSAVEQTYGVFVSSNTEILNDELLKDEIVSVSSGNIKSFTELGANVHNGIISVTLEAIVSTSTLASYAKAKGAACELVGSTFAANYKLKQLRIKNTQVALEHLMIELDLLADDMFNYEINVSPVQVKKEEYLYRWLQDNGYDPELTFRIDVSVLSNKQTFAFVEKFKNTITSLSSRCQETDDTYPLYALTQYSDINYEDSKRNVRTVGDVLTYPLLAKFPYETYYGIIGKALNDYLIVDNLGNKYVNKYPLSCPLHRYDDYIDFENRTFRGRSDTAWYTRYSTPFSEIGSPYPKDELPQTIINPIGSSLGMMYRSKALVFPEDIYQAVEGNNFLYRNKSRYLDPATKEWKPAAYVQRKDPVGIPLIKTYFFVSIPLDTLNHITEFKIEKK